MFSRINNALILGAGPAGLTAALGLARVKRNAHVLSHQNFRKNGVKASHKVLGFDGAHPAEWRRIGREQIDKPGDDTEFAEGEAIKIRHTDFGKEISKGFEIEQNGGQVWRGRKMTLAMRRVAETSSQMLREYAENWPDNDNMHCLSFHALVWY